MLIPVFRAGSRKARKLLHLDARQLRRAEPLHVKQIGPHLHLLLSYSAITTDSETIICMALRILACGSCEVLQIDCDRQKRIGKSSKHVSIIDAMSDV